MTNPPPVGSPTTLADGLVSVLAPNASPMTFWGTNSYILGHDNLCVVDPGPDNPAHLEALLAAIGSRSVSHILVTHSHLDHSPLSRTLAQSTGAPVLAYGNSNAGRSTVMKELDATGALRGGEGVDREFKPDKCIADGETIEGDGWTLKAIHTPGHFGNHLTFLWNDDAFTGDHLMGWATSMVSPPDGDLTDFMASCHKLAKFPIKRGYCGHGPPIPDVQTRLHELITHRLSRETEILAALKGGTHSASALTGVIYTDIAPALLPMAERNVLAHLVDLFGRKIVACDGTLSAQANFFLTEA